MNAYSIFLETHCNFFLVLILYLHEFYYKAQLLFSGFMFYYILLIVYRHDYGAFISIKILRFFFIFVYILHFNLLFSSTVETITMEKKRAV
jgi:hypothetical protein